MSDASERLARVEAIFHEVEGVDADVRPARLQELCGDDATLLTEVRKLLRAAERERQTSGTKRTQQKVDEAAFQQRRIGPYQLRSLLGRGGMGAVYLANRVDGQYTKQVAIKLIDVPLATDLFRDRFRQERQILAGLDHPLIARLLDGGVSEEGSPYLVMDYVSGVTITDFCEESHLSIAQRLQLFVKVCEAVQFAHQNLVVHRDLKPDNILVSADGMPHLLDFGTAKLLSPDAVDLGSLSTREGFLSFTPQYASPEQILGQPVTIGSDVYSLGVLLFVLLSGRQPYHFADFSTGEMLRVIVEAVPPRPGAGAMPYGAIDADLDVIVLKALRKEPQARYATVAEFAADVQAFLEHRPVQARRGSLRYRTGKFVRRHRLPLAAAALLFLTFLAGVAGVLWQARIANLQRARAEARSADLRELSNSLLSELDEALKDIPGSTGAQKLLVTRVLEHLDRMARDANGDRQTTLDLVSAYTRLGDVQSNGYNQNVGDTPGALASLEKALTLGAPVAAKNPRDREILRAYAAALEARGEVLSSAGDAQASGAALQAAVHVYDQVVALPGATPAVIFEAAIAYEVLGNESGEDSGLGDVNASAAAYRRALDMDTSALRLDPNYMPVLRGLPVMHMHLGALALETDPVSALAEFQTALQLHDALPLEERQKRSRIRLRAQIVGKIAASYAELGQYAMAFPLLEQEVQVFRQLSKADGNDVSALTDLYRNLYRQGDIYRFAADPLLADASGALPEVRRRNLEEAAAALQECSGVIRRILQLAPSQDSWKDALADVLLRLNTVHVDLGQASLSANEEADLLSRLKRAAQGPHASADDVSVAVQALLSVRTKEQRDSRLAVELAKQGVSLTHEREAEYMLLLARAERADKLGSQSNEVAQRGLSLLPATARAGAMFRLRRLLEFEEAAK